MPGSRADVAFVKGAPKSHASSPGVTRRFCGSCGTPLSYESERWPDEIHLFVVAFDDAAGFAPQAHVNTAEQIPWLTIHDDLPRYAKFGNSA